MNREIVPTEIRVMPRHELEDEIVRMRRLFGACAVFVNGDMAIHKAEISVNHKDRFVDIRTRG